MKNLESEQLEAIVHANPALDFRDATIDLRETIRPDEVGESDTPTVVVTAAPAAAENDENDSELPPPPKQGFEIRDLLGRGGMNVVYRALQLDLLREVGIKRIRPEKERRASAQRAFLHEAQLTGSL